MRENEELLRGHDLCDMAVPQDRASSKQSPKLTSVKSVKAFTGVCFVHGICLYQVLCKDAGSPSLEWN